MRGTQNDLIKNQVRDMFTIVIALLIEYVKRVWLDFGVPEKSVKAFFDPKPERKRHTCN